MKAKLTKRQAEVLEKINQAITHFGLPPTRVELAVEMGFSPSAAEDHLKVLARKGHIILVPGVSRGIQVVAGQFHQRRLDEAEPENQPRGCDMTAPKRGRQVKPTTSDVRAAWERIRQAADGGDIEATAMLIALGEGRPIQAPNDILASGSGSNRVLDFKVRAQVKAPSAIESASRFQSSIKIQSELLGRRKARTGAAHDRLRFSTEIARRRKDKDPSPTFSASLSLSEDLVVEAGLSVGERVDMFFDPDKKQGFIAKAESGGWALSKSGPRVTVKFTWVKGIPTISNSGACTDVTVGKEGIMFTFPDGTDFDGNARADQ